MDNGKIDICHCCINYAEVIVKNSYWGETTKRYCYKNLTQFDPGEKVTRCTAFMGKPYPEAMGPNLETQKT